MNQKKKIIVNNIIETENFAKRLAKKLKPADIICLEGDLGVGKTVIAKSIGNFFNIKDEITSPTFTILKSYNINNDNIKKLNHFDLYRIKHISELDNIGFEDYLYETSSISIIEWPEIAYDIIPKSAIKIKIEKNDIKEFSRIITYEEI